jgi:hypothetical protein
MQHPLEPDDENKEGRNLGRVLAIVAGVAVLVLFVVLHLTGAIGSGSH